MGKYIAKRILWLIPIVFMVTVVIFTIMYFVPGDVAVIMLGTAASEADYETLRTSLGLYDPYYIRLGRYLIDVFFHFDFGVSLIDKTSITAALIERFPRTFIIAILSTAIGALIGTPLGITAAARPNTLRDKLSMFISLIGISMPPFWLAMLLVLLFSLKLGWLPAQGLGGIEYYILPCLAASFAPLAMQARQTRACVVEQMRSDYVITARAKGAREARVIYRHALPNAAIPVVTQLFTSLGSKMAGAIVIEQIFGIPGIGTYLVRAINNRDYYAVQGTVIFFSIILSIVVLLTDILYAYIDPRIRVQFESKKKYKKQKAIV